MYGVGDRPFPTVFHGPSIRSNVTSMFPYRVDESTRKCRLLYLAHICNIEQGRREKRRYR